VRKIEGNRSLVLFLVTIFLFLVSTLTLVESGTPYKEPSARLNGVARIVGKVRVEGHFKKPPPLKVYKKRDFCGAEVPNESLIVGAEGSLQNAVIRLIRLAPHHTTACRSWAAVGCRDRTGWGLWSQADKPLRLLLSTELRAKKS